MGFRKFRLLMSKYGFSIAIILIELFVIFGIILYMSQIAPIIYLFLVGSDEDYLHASLVK